MVAFTVYRPMRLLVSLLALFVGASAQAQSSDAWAYFPLTPGNVWVYFHSTNPELAVGYFRWEVLGDTVIAGQSQQLVETRMFDHFYAQVATGLCSARVEHTEETLRIAGGLLKGEGVCPDILPVETRFTRQRPQPRFVVDRMRRVNTVSIMETSESHDYLGNFGEGIGLLNWYRVPKSEDGILSADSYALQSARVNGRILGEEPKQSVRPEWTRFYPIELGDEWLYARINSTRSRSMPFESPPDEWIRREVVGDTLLHGTSYRIVKERRYTSDWVLMEEALCGVRRQERMGWFEWISVEGHCAPQESSFPYASWGAPLTDSTRVERICYAGIGRDVVALDACFHLWTEPYRPDMFFVDVQFGLDLGLIYWFTANGQRTERLELWYASVGGRTYGAEVFKDPTDELPRELELENAHPNPFNGSTTLTYALPTAGTFQIELFDVRGRRLLSVDLEDRPAGRGAYQLDGTELASGVYVVRLTAPGGETSMRRIVRIR